MAVFVSFDPPLPYVLICLQPDIRDELPLILGLCTAILSSVGSHDLATAKAPEPQKQQQQVAAGVQQGAVRPAASPPHPVNKGDQMLLVRQGHDNKGSGEAGT